jgi:glycolate oxidase
MRQSEVATALRQVLPADIVLSRDEELHPYECDGLSVFRQKPMLVVLPRTEEEVRQVLITCRRLAVPVVARGAGTGLSGGSTPHESGVLLCLARLNQIVEIDPIARIARLQPGVRNLKVSEAAAPHGLYYAPDPSSQIACSIGGNVAENSGGVHCLKYGLTVHNVLAIRGLTIDGELVELGGRSPDHPGLDLLSLVIGSEGLLMVVTEVTVKLIPRPQLARVVMASFADVRAAGDAVASIIAAGIIPAGLEMMDRKATAAVEPFVKAGYDLSAEAILLAESDGTPEEVAEQITEIESVLRAAGATAMVVSSSEAERLRFWSGRKNAFPAAGRV